MGLFRSYFRDDVDELVERNVRMRIIGSRSRAARDILGMIEDGEERTASNTGLHLTFAFDYGAREEIAGAARDILGMIEDGEERTASNTGLHLTFAFDYGAREEIAAAARDILGMIED